VGRHEAAAGNFHHPDDGADEKDHRQEFDSENDRTAVVHAIATGANQGAPSKLLGALAALNVVLPLGDISTASLSGLRSLCRFFTGDGLEHHFPPHTNQEPIPATELIVNTVGY
jgi:hypothetical protein